MKYLIKSNIFVLLCFMFPGFALGFSLNEQNLSNDFMFLIMLMILEGFIFKTHYDFINLEHDHKYYIHRLPKQVFYILSPVLNILTITLIALLSSPFKWLLFIGLILTNALHLLYKRNNYFLVLLALVIYPNFFIYKQTTPVFIWWIFTVLFALGIAYYLRHKKTTVYFDDNY